MRAAGPGAVALACALLGPLGGAAPAHGAPVIVSSWPAMTATFSGNNLVWTTTVTNRLRGFSYWTTEASRVAMGPTGPRGRSQAVVAVRTQAGTLLRPLLAPTGAGDFVLTARGRGISPPVIWCCDAAGTEVVLESDGRPGARRAIAAGGDTSRTRVVLAHPSGARILSDDPHRQSSDPDERVGAGGRGEVAFDASPLNGRIAVDGDLLAFADVAEPRVVRLARLGDAGATDLARLAQPAPVVGVWVEAPGRVLVATRAGGRTTVRRYDLPRTRARIVWRGSRTPLVAIGRGVVAVADGRRVLAGRVRLKRVRIARGRVAAIATDGRRVAVFERVRNKKRQRITAARFVRVAR